MEKKKQKGTWKRFVASVLGMILVIGLTIVGTLAFMQTKSNEKNNVFTGSNDIKLYLEEPKYNLREKSDGSYTLKDANQLDPREYIPGVSYPKDPTLYNITGKQNKKNDGAEEYAEEWVAMRVDYAIDDGDDATDDPKTYSEMTQDYTTGGSVAKPAGIIEAITFNENWIKVPSDMLKTNAKYDIYIYKYKLKADEALTSGKMSNNDTMDALLKGIDGSTKDTPTAATTPLFEEVTIKGQEQLKTNGYDIASLRKFTIKLTGAAIKVMPTINMDEINETDISSSSTKSKIVVEDLVSLLQPST